MTLNFFIIFLSSILFTILGVKLAFKYKLLDLPNERKIHENPVPQIGGIVLYLCLIIELYLFDHPQLLNMIIVYSSIIVVTGILDDYYEMSVPVRILLVFFAVYLLIDQGIVVNYLGNYFYNDIYLNSFAFIFTIIAVAGLTNAFNFLDGIDGLVITQSIISLISLFLYSYLLNDSFFITNFYISLIIILLVLLFFNLGFINKYKIFLGDSGSLLLGFIISSLLIYYTQIQAFIILPILVVWIVAFPIIDFLSTVFRRLINNKNPFKPDKTHFHHVLIDCGYKKLIVLIISLYSTVLSCFGFFITIFFNQTISLAAFIIICFVHCFLTLKISNIEKQY